jgi:hypothetical protein
MATSTGQNDVGLHDINLRDERWLPFEGQGAVSTWSLVLDPRDNSFDVSTVTDVILHVRYTARAGGGFPDAVRASLASALKSNGARSFMLSVRSTFGAAYYSFFNPADRTAAQQTLTLPLTEINFPFSNLGAPKIGAITICMALAGAPDAGAKIDATVTEAGSGVNSLSFVADSGTTTSGSAPAILRSTVPFASPVAPGSFSLVVPQSSLATVPSLGITRDGQLLLDSSKFDDIMLVIDYSLD